MFAVAAFIGALKFFGGDVNDQVHKLFSLLAGVAGFPAMAISIAWWVKKTTRGWSSSVLILAVFTLIGVSIVIITGSRVYLNMIALLSTLAVGLFCWRQHHYRGVVSATVMLLGLVCFATKLPALSLLQPADFLHLALAVGWLGLSGLWATPTSESGRQDSH